MSVLAELEQLQARKLWHQLTLKLHSYVQDPEVLKNENLRKLYDEFIQPIENKMNPFTFIKIISHIITQFTDPKETVAFLETQEPKVKNDKEAFIYCKILRGEVYLDKLKNQEEAMKLINEIETLLSDIEEIGVVHNRYYLLASQLYRIQSKHTEFYRTCLKYLGSMELSSIPMKEQMQHAFLLSLAALLSDDIYNLGELLQHPILDSLRHTPNEWLIDLLYIFNSGDIRKFEEMQPKWASIGDIAVQKDKLRRKISLLCLMEMTFKRQSKDRRLTFQEIAQETKLPIDEVELLVMKALSIGLVKGSIDQVAQEVHLNWVQPRVIDKSQISSMVKRLDMWLSDVNSMRAIIEEKGLDFLKV